ncbi:MAG: hypothetical protein IKS03_07995 [Ruminococcus sp.]|nr:hypothetical protein [Ruminococcus sp.]
MEENKLPIQEDSVFGSGHENFFTDPAVDEKTKTAVSQASEIYLIIKQLIEQKEQEWKLLGGKTPLAVLLRNDIFELGAFLSALSGGFGNYTLTVLNGICAVDGYMAGNRKFVEYVENLGFGELIETHSSSPETEKALNAFTDRKTGFLDALTKFQDNDDISMIYFMYGSLITTEGNILHEASRTIQSTVGWNNYLKTQYTVLAEHLTGSAGKEFDKVLFPYLQKINDEMKEYMK